MRKSLLLICGISMLFTSCATMSFYQLYDVKAIGNTENEDFILFEDANCRVTYYLWSRGGNAGFTIYNKSDSYVTLDLAKSFFVVNGEAYDYFLNRTYTVASGVGVNNSKKIAY